VGCAIPVFPCRLERLGSRFCLVQPRRSGERLVIVHGLFERGSVLVGESIPPAGPMTVASARI
jgi:hypothetical protein